MLAAAHLGYTMGVTLVAEKLTRSKRRLDYRGVAAAALAADVVDRALFVFVLPRATSGRLIAHTLGFQLAVMLGLTTLRRTWWPYAAASVFHLALDTPGVSNGWLRQVFWPLGGFAASHINIGDPPVGRDPSYLRWVWARLKQGSEPYRHASKSALALEIGGAAIALAFGCRALLDRKGRRAAMSQSREEPCHRLLERTSRVM